MTWRAEADPSEETWANALFRSDDGRLLWLRARAGVEGAWLMRQLAPAGAGSGLRLAEELLDAERELEREDVTGVEGGGHTRKEESAPPTPYRELQA